MIKFDDIFLADLKDDFELAGKGETEFSIYDFINHDLSRAFGVGFAIPDWKLWIPIKVRKELRHASDNLKQYDSQMKWLNSKYNKEPFDVKDYITFILNNVFCDDEHDLINIALCLGNKLRKHE